MMKRSLNEIEHTCRKAARGCGLPWGVADEVGKAVRWLHVFEIDGVSSLVALLAKYDHHHFQDYAPISLIGKWKSSGELLSPIMVGMSLCDCMEEMRDQEINVSEISYPILSAGFLGQTALKEHQAVTIKWASLELVLFRDRLIVGGNREDLRVDSASALSCARTVISNNIPVSHSEITAVIGDTKVDPGAWQKLEQYAHLTYVKATEASRLSGAGAGLNDND